MSGYWTMLEAELADTIRSNRNARPKRPCFYCGIPTRALSGVCLAHDDLIDLDDGYPAALEKTGDASPGPAAGLTSPVSPVVSSATVPEPCAGLMADGGTSGPSGEVALDG